jgi:FkbM family methyltransferase
VGIKERIRNIFIDPNRVEAFSQEGEDIFLKRIFSSVPNGFYVDVGAHHPSRFSNTYMFYREGWRGINIDAMPGSMEYFSKRRPEDINLEYPVGTSGQELTYYIFDDPALNGFSKEISDIRNKDTSYKVVDTKSLKIMSLKEILDKHLPESQDIHFMSIDVEGLELDVLKSNDWKRYRPKMLIVEILETDLENLATSEAYQFLKDSNYRLVGKTYHSYFFAEQDFHY